ncbi:hypothetical protein SH1V18_20840 [Vallitalea longa]|uniref:Uncharacterized protein n=1 Tax=Vallitalea longa TaxID=2936439 RepID=A0A9W5YCX9_9FIRM|nr:hypothetical protein [Vallitalea longa]GKX29604.1 hypothetical protein SH1V18_20840 [Vallitalea longa]
MKKYSYSSKIILLIIVVISLLCLVKVVTNNNREKTRDRVINGFSRNIFNSNKIINYNDLSEDMKNHITENEFNSIDSWDKAQFLFNSHFQETKDSSIQGNEFDFKYDTVTNENGNKNSIAYEVCFVSTPFNMRISRVFIVIDQ